MSTLKDRVVLITGAARGIGAGTARAVVARGAKVVLLDWDKAPLESLADELGSENAVSAVVDVCDLAAVEAATASGVARFGGIDIVMANAGIASYGSVRHVDPATFRRVIDVNITGVFHTVRAALPSITERRGYILIVSSLAAFAPAPGMAAYGASKAASEQFASALRLELAHEGVDVGSAHMSWVDTPLVRDARHDLPSFGDMLAALPGPLSRTTSLERCVQAFVRGLEDRQRRIYVPGWVGLLRWLKALVSTPWAERPMKALVPQILPTMDREIAALGRWTSARNLATDPSRPQSADPGDCMRQS